MKIKSYVVNQQNGTLFVSGSCYFIVSTANKIISGTDASTLSSRIFLYKKALNANKRIPIASTKSRGLVSGGGIKPWKQKGTGRARQGSIRAPQWKGGGVVWGPKSSQRVYKQKITKRERTFIWNLGWEYFLNSKSNRIILIDYDLNLTKPSTSTLNKFILALIKLDNVNCTNKTQLLFLSSAKNLRLSVRNLQQVTLIFERGSLNVASLLDDNVVFIAFRKEFVSIINKISNFKWENDQCELKDVINTSGVDSEQVSQNSVAEIKTE